MKRSYIGAICIAATAIFLISPSVSNAYDSYNGCNDCHGDFRDNGYVSNADGTPWNDDLMGGHQDFMSGCDVCHSGSGFSPVRISISDDTDKPQGCVGCHGRVGDETGVCTFGAADVDGEHCGSGMGLRKLHEASPSVPANTCYVCHNTESGAVPVRENEPPFNFRRSGVTLTSACSSENMFGPTGLDNDGDGIADMADTQCQTPGDMNIDGYADILWRHGTSGRNVVHLMDGAPDSTSVATNTTISTVAAPQWQIAGNGDYNGDDNADILWRDTGTGRIVMHLMDGINILSNVDVATVSDPQWKIVGSGDYNGDTKSDMLWRHGVSGRNVVLLMDGATILSNTDSSLIVSQQWQVAGNGDYNGDGKSDVLWRHSGNGRNVVHLMDGASISSNTDISIVPAPQWTVVGNGDYNGDTKSDILWRDGSTGRIVVHLMGGTASVPAISSNSDVSIVSDAQWQIVGSGDYNGDGNSDILWRHGISGRNVTHLMDGATILVNTSVGSVSGSEWSVVNTP